MAAEHDDAVAAAAEHLAAKPEVARPLGELPDSFAGTRESLHFVAEHLLKPKREMETGNEIALMFTPGGFGTAPWEDGVTSGGRGQARVDGVELVSVELPYETRVGADDLERGVGLLGVEEPPKSVDRSLRVEADAASALADWFAFGTVALAGLLDRHPDPDSAPIRLWPEHFDVATEVGSEAAGERANFGASPGDESHPEPYLYVGPWDQSRSGEVWNATAFVGADLSYAELLEADDQLSAAAAFFDRCLDALAGA